MSEMSFSTDIVRWRYKLLPDHVIGEVLTKKWVDSAIPFLALALLVFGLGPFVPHFFEWTTLGNLARQFAEFGLIVLGLTIVMMSGGIDLSVGSVFALSVLMSLIGMNVEGWSAGTGLVATLAVGASCGALNGLLVGYVRMRAFLTTLVTLIIFRIVVRDRLSRVLDGDCDQHVRLRRV
ncbi:ABC transporter permease [Bradyrhizobium diazoefficiens]|uniref:ABC transporter permease n=1 Tax=Bradyrhizobium diazoefficiens TaxID=1355477 RepID=UPI00348C544F